MKLKHLNNLHKNTSGFLVGGAYSINNISPEEKKKIQDNFIVVGTNKAYKRFNLDYLIFLDATFYTNFYQEFQDLSCVKLTHLNIPKKYSKQIKHLLKVKRERDTKNKISPYKITEPISVKNNSGTFGLRIAYLLGLNPIYIIGVELNPEDIDKKRVNFHNDYKQYIKNNVTKKTFDGFYQAFNELIQVLKKRNIEIYSCSKTSRLNNIIEYKSIKNI